MPTIYNLSNEALIATVGGNNGVLSKSFSQQVVMAAAILGRLLPTVAIPLLYRCEISLVLVQLGSNFWWKMFYFLNP